MNIKNHFLVAMPSMMDSNFRYAVIYICEHNDEGSMGLIINRPIDISVGNMLDQIDIDRPLAVTRPNSLQQPVFFGGPVSEDRGFVLHKSNNLYGSSIKLANNITVTTSKDILGLLGTSNEPEQFIVALGYTGWEKGQLEKELADSSWLVIEADPKVIFDEPVNLRWKKAIEQLGINPLHLSHDIGHA